MGKEDLKIGSKVTIIEDQTRFEGDNHLILEQVLRAFDGFETDVYPQTSFKGELVCRRAIAEMPLYIVSPKDEDIIRVIEAVSNSDRIVIASSDAPKSYASVVAHWGRGFKTDYMVEWWGTGVIRDVYFEAPKYTDPDGTGGFGQGCVAAVRDGIIQKKYEQGKAKFFVVFAGIDGQLNSVQSAWHGCVIMEPSGQGKVA